MRSAYPNPTVGAVWVAGDGSILGQGFSNYKMGAIRSAIVSAGVELTGMPTEWVLSFPSTELREKIASSTLYVTLEPSNVRRGTAFPSITQLIEQTGIRRVVIGSADPVAERQLKGAEYLHFAGVKVRLGKTLEKDCEELIEEYAVIANGKLRTMARKHYKIFGRPLGFLHCSVVDSSNVEAFARQGNAFGTQFGGETLSYRNFGS